ncbi:MAG: hypothetical protein Q7S95_01205 [bacterium]|nr:hypothetical protein [bacterium]
MTRKRVLSVAIIMTAMLAVAIPPALADGRRGHRDQGGGGNHGSFLPQASQIREMPESRERGGGRTTYLPRAPEIGGYERGHRRERGGGHRTSAPWGYHGQQWNSYHGWLRPY